ncbi:MAG: LPS export ABC transporter permease LptF [Magnetovibrionaceae bacterium]
MGAKAFNLYVLRQLLLALLMTTAALTAIIWLTQSLRYIEMIVSRGISAGTFVHLTALLLPNFLPLILPFAIFLVVAFVYAKLIADRELVVMRAAGLSHLSLSKPALVAAFLVMCLSYALNLYIVPWSYQVFREMQWEIRYSVSHFALQEGAFNSLGDGATAYIRERRADGQLIGILVHDQRTPTEPVTYMAERGALFASDGRPRVVMFNGNRQTVSRDSKELSILYFDRYVLEIESDQVANSDRYREARERTLGELLTLKPEDLHNPKDYGKFRVEAHRRLTSPLMVMGLTTVALAALLSGGFSRRSQAKRIVAAVVCMISVLAATLGLENLVAKQLHLIPLLYVNGIVPIILALLVMHMPSRRPGARSRQRRAQAAEA